LRSSETLSRTNRVGFPPRLPLARGAAGSVRVVVTCFSLSDGVSLSDCVALSNQWERTHRLAQGRQDSNLQPPVLETGALPIEPRP
jgi:hypothetical protein